MLKFSLKKSLQSFESLFLIWCDSLPIYGNLKKRQMCIVLLTLLIKNGGHAFLIRLDLMLPMSLWKEFKLLQILNDL